MDAMGTLQPHPAAELFPLLEGDAYESFKADIAERGLIEPIWLCEGKILDGRNRYRACLDTGVEPKFREYKGDSPTHFVWSLNGERRHMTKSKLAAVASNMIPLFEAEAKKRQEATRAQPGQRADQRPPKNGGTLDSSGESAAQAASTVGVSKSYVHDANYIKKRDPGLFARVESGEITVNKARRILDGKDNPPDPNARNQPREKRVAEITKLAKEGYRAEQIATEIGVSAQYVRDFSKREGIDLPDAKIGKPRKIDAKRVIEETVNGLSGYALGLQTINSELSDLDPDDCRYWAESLTESLKPINKLRRKLMEIANG